MTNIKPSASLRGQAMLETLKHTVGYPRFYRNSFCAEVESEDWYLCMDLLGLGLMRGGTTHPIDVSSCVYFYVTHAGLRYLEIMAAEEGQIK